LSALTLIYENENELIRDYTENGNERAATAFVREYQSFVYSTVLRYVGSYDDADDIAQEVFIKALNNLNKFRGDSSLKTWLYRIAVNLSLNFKRKKQFFSFFSNDEEQEYHNIPDKGISPDEELENSELVAEFRKALDLLPEKQRETFHLRYYEELPYEEISKMLGTSVGGLKANYFQAVKKLAKYLKQNYPVGG
jgi:RNA polymerase sigma factor (sigma-70 family)